MRQTRLVLMRAAATLSGMVMLACASQSAFAREPQDAPPAPNSEQQGLADIVVTAQRREENVQKSSLSIEVLNSEAIARSGVTNIRDLTAAVPGVQIGQTAGVSQIYIRGVGDAGGNVIAQSSVAVNVDGVVIATPTDFGTEFYDVSRVEVLKGPQGTLYGRNASGGAINILTNRPTQELGGSIEAEVGNYDLRRATGALNVPVSTTLALRGAFQATHRDGYLSDGTNDDKFAAGRLGALWTPNDSVSLFVTVNGSRRRDHGSGASLLSSSLSRDPWIGPSDPRTLAYLSQFSPNGVPYVTLKPGMKHQDLWAASAELQIDTGFATLTVLPAYRSGKYDMSSSSNGYPVDETQRSSQKTLEVRLSNNSPTLKWVLGGYYFDLGQRSHFRADQAFVVVDITTNDLSTRSLAAFGEATLSLSPALRVIGGLRYTNERKSLNGFGVVTGGSFLMNSKYDDEAVTWKAGLEYDLAPRVMAFATASTGFKGGGLNLVSPGPETRYAPEKLTAYTVGLKSRFADNRVQLNIEGFYWNYKGHQENRLALDSSGLLLVFIQNAGSAKIYGGNADLTWKPTPRDRLHLGVEYAHSKYDVFSYPPPFPGPPDPNQTGCRAGANGDIDCSGFELTRAPAWSGSASYDYDFSLANGGKITAGADLSFASARWLSADFLRPNGRAPAYALVNASLGYIAPDERFSINLWVRNVTNTAVYTQALQSAVYGDFWASIGAPRTYGVRTSVKF